MSKQNTLRKKKGKAVDFESEKKSKETPITRKAFWQWILLRDERAKQVFGAFLMLSAIFMSISFVSFLFTWKTDQNVVFGFGWDDFVASNPDAARNTMGMFGALLGHLFIHKWFGIASFAIPVILIVGGAKLAFKIKLLPFLKTIRYSFFIVIWLALLMGMLLGASYPFLGGAFGYHGYLWLKGLMGIAGTGIFLFFYLLTFLIVVYNLNLSIRNKKLKEALEAANDEANDASETDGEEKLSTSELAEETAIMGSEDAANEGEDVDASFTEDKGVEEIDKVSPDDIKLIVKDDEAPPFEIEQTESIPLEAKTPEPEPKKEDEGNLELSIEEAVDEEVEKPKGDVNRGGLNTPYDPTLDLSGFKFPTLDLLKDYGDTRKVIDQGELENNKNMIVETLKNYGIGVGQIKATIGPTVTLYEIVPEAGVRISRIKNLEDDIALSLAALGIRIIAPIPGKGTIGIEVPNKKPEIVPMSTVSASSKFQNSDADLPVILGKTIANEIYVADLAKMPHLLMAGATGQGKSVGINALLVSLLYKKHPSQLKFVLVDPKKVELTLYKRIERHYLAKIPGDGEAIITDTKKVVNTLNSLCVEMDERYNLLQDAAVRNIKEYNARFVARKLPPTDDNKHKFLPYIVVVIDELADLMMTAGKEVEQPIARLAQLARAIGIHLIIATQRPSVNIITGTIKANFPARIAFRVTSKIDSRTILDGGGADQLIGKGDMLYSNGNDMIRLQCPFVDTPEVEEITSYIGNQRGYSDAFMLPEVQEEGAGGNEEFDPSDRDTLFEDAARVVVLAQQGSTSLIQRKLKLGYNRAGRIIDQLENAGIVGSFEGSKAREVLIPDEYSLEQKLKELNG